jgi:hypothetical protein
LQKKSLRRGEQLTSLDSTEESEFAGKALTFEDAQLDVEGDEDQNERALHGEHAFVRGALVSCCLIVINSLQPVTSLHKFLFLSFLFRQSVLVDERGLFLSP